MKYFALTSLVATLALAQEPAPAPAAAPAPVAMEMAPAPAAAAASAVQTVLVGGTAGLLFSPPSLMAPVGSTVDFIFLQKNHSVVQSTLDTPCKAMAGGFDSGFLPNAEGSIVNAPKFSITVNDTKPIWGYCKQRVGTHCGKSMVFAINPSPDITAKNSFRAYQESAIQQNGTQVLSEAALVAQAQAAATPPTASTVTVNVAGAQGAAPAAASGSQAAGGVAAGSGQSGTGETCTCSCMCAPGSVPRADAVGNFGGWAGMLP